MRWCVGLDVNDDRLRLETDLVVLFERILRLNSSQLHCVPYTKQHIQLQQIKRFSPLVEHIWEHLKTHNDELPRGRIKVEPDLVTQVENLRGNIATFSIFSVEFKLM